MVYKSEEMEMDAQDSIEEENDIIKEGGDGSHVECPVVTFDVDVGVSNKKFKEECLEAEEKPSLAEEEEEDVVPDGGYGWVIVLGSFLAHVLVGGLERDDGVFYLQFRSHFGESAQLTAWVLALVSTIRLMFGPVASTLCGRYSARSAVMIGGILLTVACLLTASAPNFWFLFFSHTTLQGFGRGFMYAPSIIIVGEYFDKRRGLSTGLGTSGVGVGTFLIVPLTQLLFDFYGFWGAFLVLAGILTNGFVVAMLLRPLSLHQKFVRAFARKESKTAAKAEEGGVLLSKSRQKKGHDVPEDTAEDSQQSSPLVKALTVSEQNGHNEKSTTSSHSQKNQPDGKLQHQKRDGCLKSFLKTCFPVENKQKRSTAGKRLFHFYLLKDSSFLCFCLSICLFTAAFKAAFTFIPALVKSKGLSETDATMILSISGVLDTFGRIGAGLILDCSKLKPWRPMLYNSLIFVIALISFVLPFFSSFTAFVVMCGLYGIMTGAYVSQKSVIIVDILGMQHMSSSFGILILFQGIGTCVGPPLSGAFRDFFGGFDEAFYLGGGLMLVAGFLMVVGNCFLHFSRKGEKESVVDAGSQAAGPGDVAD